MKTKIHLENCLGNGTPCPFCGKLHEEEDEEPKCPGQKNTGPKEV